MSHVVRVFYPFPDCVTGDAIHSQSPGARGLLETHPSHSDKGTECRQNFPKIWGNHVPCWASTRTGLSTGAGGPHYSQQADTYCV